jgi:hypothetical protein
VAIPTPLGLPDAVAVGYSDRLGASPQSCDEPDANGAGQARFLMDGIEHWTNHLELIPLHYMQNSHVLTAENDGLPSSSPRAGR